MTERFADAVSACVESGPVAIQRFADALEPEWIEAALAVTGTASVRRRKLPADQVVWLVLGMCLMMDRSILDVCEHMSLVLPGVDSLAPSAVPSARYRLGPAPLEWLFHRMAREYAHADRDDVLGLHVYAVDGTHIRVPDSDLNFNAFGKPSSRNGTDDAGYPQVRLVALLNVRTRLVADAAFARYNTGEITLARTLWDAIPDHSLTILDRGFIDFASFVDITTKGHDRHVLIRMPRTMRFVEEAQLEDGSRLGYLQPTHRAHQVRPDLPARLRVRVVDYQHQGGEPSRIFTTILDVARAPAAALVALYHERWEIEVAYDELKTHLTGRRESLRSQKPEGVMQEVWGLLLLYNLVRWEMKLVADARGVAAHRVSFTTSLHVIRGFWLTAAQTRSPGTIPQRLRDLRTTLTTLILPERRSDRRYPRQVKIKMSNYARNRGTRLVKAIEEPEEPA